MEPLLRGPGPKGLGSMPSLRTRRARPFSVIPVVLSLAVLSAVATPVASALPSSRQMPVSRASSGTFMATFGGKGYHLAAGQTIRFPIIWRDGSRGFLEFGSSVRGTSAPTAQAQSAGAPSGPIYCGVQGGWLTGVNDWNQLLWRYTLYQHWCWDGRAITSHDAPYYSWYVSPGVGWSLAYHAEWTAYFDGRTGRASATMRANGPLGLGCNAGYINISYASDGTYGSSPGGASEYGC